MVTFERLCRNENSDYVLYLKELTESRHSGLNVQARISRLIKAYWPPILSNGHMQKINKNNRANQTAKAGADTVLADAAQVNDSLPASQEKESPQKKEIGGRKNGLDPSRYGDWEMNGRCIDF